MRRQYWCVVHSLLLAGFLMHLFMDDFLPGCLFAVVILLCFMIGMNVWWVYMQLYSHYFGNKVVLYWCCYPLPPPLFLFFYVHITFDLGTNCRQVEEGCPRSCLINSHSLSRLSPLHRRCSRLDFILRRTVDYMLIIEKWYDPSTTNLLTFFTGWLYVTSVMTEFVNILHRLVVRYISHGGQRFTRLGNLC